ncbi:acid stress chaperone HdeA [Paraburkholderia sp. GAS199]|uniref:HdeA/HdeB family chaperone n=1 Tax=Paraburkholderia sp. GAS199 TaxID=3035126 RepID=UPI003D1A8830
MNRAVIIAFFIAAVSASSVQAQTAHKMNPTKMKCEDFVAVADEYKPAVVYYVAGVDKLGVTGTDTIVEDTATPIAAVVEECKKSPKTSFRAKIREMYNAGKLALFDHH